MSIEIKMRKNEPIDRALRRMKKKLERECIIKDARMKRYAEKPSERRRRKAWEANTDGCLDKVMADFENQIKKVSIPELESEEE